MLNGLGIYLQETIKGAIRHPEAHSVARTVRILPRWYRSRHLSLVEAGLPWFAFDAIDFLSDRVRPDWTVFEYGMGGSTIFFLSRVHALHSVDSSAEWHEKLAVRISRFDNAGKWTASLVPGEPADRPLGAGAAAQLESFLSSDGRDYKKYAQVISSYPDGHFDCVLVDGRARPSCLFAGQAKLRPGGWLILDNAEREHYQPAGAFLDSQGWKRWRFYGPIPTSLHFSMTEFWQKPEA